MRVVLLVLSLYCFLPAKAQEPLRIALAKYKGGGDWYANPSALPNLIAFCNEQLNMSIAEEPSTVEVGSPYIFNYPFVHLTGHGNVVFTNEDAENLRNYLIAGGFLHIDDNYGLDQFVRPAMRKVFPELEFVELPFEHEIYHMHYDFNAGPPKIHEHDKQPAQGFALIYEGRVVCYYTFESDLGDGWEDPEVHNDPEDLRLKALKMGANILSYAFGR